MSTKNGNGHVHAAMSDEARAKALASMSDIDRVKFEQGEAMLAATLERNRLASGEVRARVSAESRAVERLRVVEEEARERAAQTHEWSADVVIQFDLGRVIRGAGRVPVTVRLIGDVVTGEPHRIRSIASFEGCARAEELLMQNCWEPWLDVAADAKKRADDAGLAALRKRVEGRSHAEGFMHRRFSQLHRPLMEMCIQQGVSLEDLIAARQVELTDAGIVVSDEPVGVELRP